MTTPLELQDLARMADQFVDAHLRAYARNSCIVGTRLFIECLRRFDPRIDAFGLCVTTAVLNPKYAELMGDTHYLDHMAQPEPPEWVGTGAWQVVLGAPKEHPRDGDWPGHLVAIVNRRYAVDCTIVQAARPEKDIVILPESMVFGVNEPWLRGRSSIHGVSTTNVSIHSWARPYDKTWRLTPGWTRPLERVDEDVLGATLGQWHGQRIVWGNPLDDAIRAAAK